MDKLKSLMPSASTGGKSKSKKGGSSTIGDMPLITSTGGSSLKIGGEYEKAVGGEYEKAVGGRRRKSSKRRSSKRRSSRRRSSKSRR